VWWRRQITPCSFPQSGFIYLFFFFQCKRLCEMHFICEYRLNTGSQGHKRKTQCEIFLAVKGNQLGYLWAELPLISDRRKHFHWSGKSTISGKPWWHHNDWDHFRQCKVKENKLILSFSSYNMGMLCSNMSICWCIGNMN